jgi:hypothetical protein
VCRRAKMEAVSVGAVVVVRARAAEMAARR